MSEDKGKKRRGKGKPFSSEKAKAAAKKRWAAPGAKWDHELAKFFEGSPTKVPNDTKAWAATPLGVLMDLGKSEAGELEQGGSHPPSSAATTGMGTPPPSAEGDLKNSSPTANDAPKLAKPHDVVLGHDLEQDPHLHAAGGDELRRRLVAEELERQRAIVRERLAGRREEAVRGPAGQPRPENRQAAYLKSDAIKSEVLQKVQVAPGTVPGRQGSTAVDPSPAVPSGAATGTFDVIVSTCNCNARSQALTLYGAQVKERAHLDLSADCRAWATERDYVEIFTRTLEKVPAEQYVALQKIEPEPPLPSAQPPVRP